MQERNGMKIAGNLTIKDWKELQTKLDSKENALWSLAFSFFEQRIITRYLNPINQILEMDLNTGEGFAVVNLQCSLIETIECFLEGWICEDNKYYYRKIEGNNPLAGIRVFESFFKEREPFKSSIPSIPNSFYKDVRCGLLHETQTKNGWLIREDKSIHSFYNEEDKGKKKIIYRSNFQKAILEVIENYRKIIAEGVGEKIEERRKNFSAKFHHICTESKTKK